MKSNDFHRDRWWLIDDRICSRLFIDFDYDVKGDSLLREFECFLQLTASFVHHFARGCS